MRMTRDLSLAHELAAVSPPQFVDISAWQPSEIDWRAYRAWSAQWDGISRVSLRSSYGVGYTDQHYRAYRAGALAAGIDVIIHYHYGYPQYNAAVAEADWQAQVIGGVRPQDYIMLDYEEQVPQATAQWAYEWLLRQEGRYGKLPTIYASDYYVRSRLQDSRLAKYPLTLANWKFDPSARPACPLPWRTYLFLQFTDRAMVPGISSYVDVNVYLGGKTMGVPEGWRDDGTTLVAPNNYRVVLGFREWVLSHDWDAGNWPVENERATPSLEDSNPALGAGQQQIFRTSMLGYTRARGVFLEWLGQELLYCRGQVAKYYALAKQVPDLQAEVTKRTGERDEAVARARSAEANANAALGQLEVANGLLSEVEKARDNAQNALALAQSSLMGVQSENATLQQQVAALQRELAQLAGIPAETVQARLSEIDQRVLAGADVLTSIHNLATAAF